MNNDKKDKEKLVAIIPARGGSKRIPRKNIRLLAGKPLVGYAIEAGLASPSIERVIVSTDDEEIAGIAKEFGAEVPFLRPPELAGDMVPDWPVFEHLINWLRKNEKYEFDYLLNLRCTTPLKTVEDIEGAYARLLATQADSIRSITCIEDVALHPYWIVKKTGEYGEPFLEGIDRAEYHGKRQLLPEVWRYNGVVDIVRTESIMRHPTDLYGKKMAVYEIPEERAFDIDTELDFLICECLMEKGFARVKPCQLTKHK